MTSAAAEPLGSTAREHRHGDAIWITTPDFEARGRAAGLPDAAVIEQWLAVHDGNGASPGTGRAPTRVEDLPGSSERVHVRRALHGGWLAPLWRGRIAGLGRLREELRVTARLHAAGAPVPAPAFALARRDGLLWRAALCTRHVEQAVDAIAFLRAGPTRTAATAAARAAGRAVRCVHDLGLRHADLHLGNLLVRGDETSGFRAWVIDLDRARLGAPLPVASRRRQLARLRRSLDKRGLRDALGRDGLDGFCEGYAADRPDGD